jgi:1A family penicillin-binding protein
LIFQFFKKIFFIIYSLILFGIVLSFLFYVNVQNDIPRLPKKLSFLNLSLPTEIYSSDGNLIKVLGRRNPVSIEEISPHFLNAIVSVEDARFYRHKGVDHIALARAIYINLKKRRVIQGGSTISQQLAKNLFFSFERNWRRKVKELLIALQMESSFSKQEILEAYSNQIYFGNGAYGVEDASKVYFGIRAKDLTLLQSATLAGIPHAPNQANPFSNYERSQKRALFILDRMVSEGYISSNEKREAFNSSLNLTTPDERSDPNLYFVDYILDKLEKDYGKEFVYFGGLKIFTTLNTQWQKYAQEAVSNHLKFLEKSMPVGIDEREPLQSALVAVENQTGAVRAMLGGRNYSYSQFNRAVSNNRMPGSSFKPFVYLTGMEILGYHPGTVVVDEPVTFNLLGGKSWSPANFGNKYMGNIILKKALMHSVNLVSAQLVWQVKPEKVIETARRFGIMSPLGNNLSLALGTSGVSPLEMAAAYSILANLGIWNEPYFIKKIEDFSGHRLHERFFRSVQKYSPDKIYPLVDMMKSVIEEGTGRTVKRMGFDRPAGGKTGTTNDGKDAWFIGFTKELSTSVWVGKDNNGPMADVNGREMTGGRGAAPIWTFFMEKALEGKEKKQFPVPEGIKFVSVDYQTGLPTDKPGINSLQIAISEEVEFPKLEKESKDEILLQNEELKDEIVPEVIRQPESDESGL